MPWNTEQKIFIVEAYFRQKSIHAAQLQFKERFGCREFPVHSMIYRLVNRFRPMGLCITSIEKTLTDNHTLDDRNHQGHRTTLLLSETLLPTAQASLFVGEARSCDNQRGAICPGSWQVLDSTWSTERGRQGPPVVPAGWCHPHSSNESLAWLQQRFSDRLISRRCVPQWSPHSPDVNPVAILE